LLIHWIPALLGVLMIMTESTDVMNADNTSRWLYPVWAAIFGHVNPDTWAEIHHLIRKTGHFVGYGLVSLAFFWSWRMTLGRRDPRRRWAYRRKAAVLALACTLALASADEYHQRFLPDRTSSVYDVGIDVSGGITAQLLLFAGLALITRKVESRMERRLSMR
jgi:VanZ family protein